MKRINQAVDHTTTMGAVRFRAKDTLPLGLPVKVVGYNPVGDCTHCRRIRSSMIRMQSANLRFTHIDPRTHLPKLEEKLHKVCSLRIGRSPIGKAFPNGRCGGTKYHPINPRETIQLPNQPFHLSRVGAHKHRVAEDWENMA